MVSRAQSVEVVFCQPLKSFLDGQMLQCKKGKEDCSDAERQERAEVDGHPEAKVRYLSMRDPGDEGVADSEPRHYPCQIPVEESGLHASTNCTEAGNSDKVPVLLLALCLRRAGYGLAN